MPYTAFFTQAKGSAEETVAQRMERYHRAEIASILGHLRPRGLVRAVDGAKSQEDVFLDMSDVVNAVDSDTLAELPDAAPAAAAPEAAEASMEYSADFAADDAAAAALPDESPAAAALADAPAEPPAEAAPVPVADAPAPAGEDGAPADAADADAPVEAAAPEGEAAPITSFGTAATVVHESNEFKEGLHHDESGAVAGDVPADGAAAADGAAGEPISFGTAATVVHASNEFKKGLHHDGEVPADAADGAAAEPGAPITSFGTAATVVHASNEFKKGIHRDGSGLETIGEGEAGAAASGSSISMGTAATVVMASQEFKKGLHAQEAAGASLSPIVRTLPSFLLCWVQAARHPHLSSRRAAGAAGRLSDRQRHCRGPTLLFLVIYPQHAGNHTPRTI